MSLHSVESAGYSRRFPIPMRGNELTECLRFVLKSRVSDPHEG